MAQCPDRNVGRHLQASFTDDGIILHDDYHAVYAKIMNLNSDQGSVGGVEEGRPAFDLRAGVPPRPSYSCGAGLISNARGKAGLNVVLEGLPYPAGDCNGKAAPTAQLELSPGCLSVRGRLGRRERSIAHSRCGVTHPSEGRLSLPATGTGPPPWH